jgi:DNA-binding GntR family transcriptional regulator
MMALSLGSIRQEASIGSRVYREIRSAIAATNLYEIAEADLRLDERELATRLGVSRTPVREALLRLEHEGLVRNAPRRGFAIARKTKAELLEIIVVWAALESMAARLVAQRATSEAIGSLRAIFAHFDGDGSRHTSTSTRKPTCTFISGSSTYPAARRCAGRPRGS